MVMLWTKLDTAGKAAYRVGYRVV